MRGGPWRCSAGSRLVSAAASVGAVALMAVEAVTALVVPILIGNLTDFLKDGKPWRPLGLRPSADATIPLLALSHRGGHRGEQPQRGALRRSRSPRPAGSWATTCARHCSRTCSSCRWPSTCGAAPVTCSPGSPGTSRPSRSSSSSPSATCSAACLLLAGTLVYLFWQSWQHRAARGRHRAAAGVGLELLRPPDQGCRPRSCGPARATSPPRRRRC